MKMSSKDFVNERRMWSAADARMIAGAVDEINGLRHDLESGIVEFTYFTDSWHKAHVVGTTSEDVIPSSVRRRLDPQYDRKVARFSKNPENIIWFWDLDKNEVRAFNTNRFDDVLRLKRTSKRLVDEDEGSIARAPRESFYDEEDERNACAWVHRSTRSLARALSHGTIDCSTAKV